MKKQCDLCPTCGAAVLDDRICSVKVELDLWKRGLIIFNLVASIVVLSLIGFNYNWIAEMIERRCG